MLFQKFVFGKLVFRIYLFFWKVFFFCNFYIMQLSYKGEQSENNLLRYQ
jgi:hypothetical protein